MDCTIGWVKIKNGYILFKNRDFFSNFKLHNMLFFRKGALGLQHKKFFGYTAGVNIHGVGIVVAGSNFDVMTKKKPIRMWPVCKYALERSKTAEEAKNIIIGEFKKQNPTSGGNTIVSDLKKAFVIENTGRDIVCGNCKDFIVRTNHFIMLKNKYPLSNSKGDNESSFKRYDTANMFLKKNRIVNVSYICKILRSHIPKKGNNSICRHGSKMKTVSSIIFYVKKDKILVYSVLNQNPCEREFEVIELQTTIA
jgi:hypothetical protein